jgi:hypothetical protein
MTFLKIFFLMLLLSSAAFSAPALQRVVTFTQPNGSQFKGQYKGDASFHWIQSNGDVIVYNPKDKYYYKAKVDKDKGLVFTNEKPMTLSTQLRGLNAASTKQKQLDAIEKSNLYILYKKSKIGNYPR